MENNSIRVQGKVLTEPKLETVVQDAEDIYIFDIEVKRKSGTVDVLKVRISNITSGFDSITVGTILEVCGEVRTRQKHGRLEHSIFCKDLSLIYHEVDTTENNACKLVGRVYKEPLKRKAKKTDRVLCDTVLEVSSNHGKKYYIPCITWGRYADVLASASKGDMVTANGRFQSRVIYKNESSFNVYELSANNISVENKDAIC